MPVEHIVFIPTACSACSNTHHLHAFVTKHFLLVYLALITDNTIWHMAQEVGLKGCMSDYDDVTMRWSAKYKEQREVATSTQSSPLPYSGSSSTQRRFQHVLQAKHGKRKLPVVHCFVEHEGSKTCVGDSGPDALQRWTTLEESEEKVKKERVSAKGIADDYSLRAALRMSGWVPFDHADHAMEYFNYDFEYARSPEETSFVGSVLHTYEDYDTENFLVADERGFSTIVMNDCQEAFGNCAPVKAGKRSADHQGPDLLQGEGPWLLLGKNVTHVVSGCDTRSASWDSGVPFCVKTDDGLVLSADHIILTFPLGVLQNDLVQFSPPLPKWKQKALHRMDVGLFSKV